MGISSPKMNLVPARAMAKTTVATTYAMFNPTRIRGSLPAAGPGLLQGFEGEVSKVFVHPLWSLVDVADGHSERLSDGHPGGRTYSEVSRPEVKDRVHHAGAVALPNQVSIVARYKAPATRHYGIG
jgi:hypothetical protein